MRNEVPFRIWNKDSRKMLYCHEAARYILDRRNNTNDLIASYYCGVQDHRGKKIYSGDILKKITPKSNQADDSFIFIDFTNHNDSGFAFTVELYKFGSDVGYFFLQDVLPDYIEDNYFRIGNIFEDNEEDDSLSWRQIAENYKGELVDDVQIDFEVS